MANGQEGRHLQPAELDQIEWDGEGVGDVYVAQQAKLLEELRWQSRSLSRMQRIGRPADWTVRRTPRVLEERWRETLAADAPVNAPELADEETR